MVERIHLLHSYIDQAKSQLTQMKKIDQNQKAKLKKYKKQNQEFDDQALHYEYLIRKYRPDLDPEKLWALHAKLEEGKETEATLTQKVLEESGMIKKDKEIKVIKTDQAVQKEERRPRQESTGIDAQREFEDEVEKKHQQEKIELMAEARSLWLENERIQRMSKSQVVEQPK